MAGNTNMFLKGFPLEAKNGLDRRHGLEVKVQGQINIKSVLWLLTPSRWQMYILGTIVVYGVEMTAEVFDHYELVLHFSADGVHIWQNGFLECVDDNTDFISQL